LPHWPLAPRRPSGHRRRLPTSVCRQCYSYVWATLLWHATVLPVTSPDADSRRSQSWPLWLASAWDIIRPWLLSPWAGWSILSGCRLDCSSSLGTGTDPPLLQPRRGFSRSSIFPCGEQCRTFHSTLVDLHRGRGSGITCWPAASAAYTLPNAVPGTGPRRHCGGLVMAAAPRPRYCAVTAHSVVGTDLHDHHLPGAPDSRVPDAGLRSDGTGARPGHSPKAHAEVGCAALPDPRRRTDRRRLSGPAASWSHPGLIHARR